MYKSTRGANPSEQAERDLVGNGVRLVQLSLVIISDGVLKTGPGWYLMGGLLFLSSRISLFMDDGGARNYI